MRDAVVVIIGATGGLGRVFAQACDQVGAKLILAGRDPQALDELRDQFPPAVIVPVDITDPASITALQASACAAYGQIDVVINAAGYDVRRAFGEHSQSDIQQSVAINLTAAMLLTHAFLPVMRARNSGMIVHVGGFGDGRLAFPYYSANVASRAGLFSFIESLNRELRLEQSGVVIGYFSPSPTDTAAERPFHPIWREMQTPIVPPQTVADALLTTIAKRQPVTIMGGAIVRGFAALNSLAPSIADSLAMRKYGMILQRYFHPTFSRATPTATPLAQKLRILAITLVVLSFVLYGGLLLLPFLPLTTPMKVLAAPILIGLGEATFWIGGLMLGREVIDRFKGYLNPCNWCYPRKSA